MNTYFVTCDEGGSVICTAGSAKVAALNAMKTLYDATEEEAIDYPSEDLAEFYMTVYKVHPLSLVLNDLNCHNVSDISTQHTVVLKLHESLELHGD